MSTIDVAGLKAIRGGLCSYVPPSPPKHDCGGGGHKKSSKGC